jgi:CubicO group peptidase (beta-lactamase class C family)
MHRLFWQLMVATGLLCPDFAAATSPLPVGTGTILPGTSGPDTWLRTKAGIAFVQPVGWTRSADGDIIRLRAPESGAHIAIVDAPTVSADEAVAHAWRRYRGAQPELLKVEDRAPSNGWAQVRAYRYRHPEDPSRLLLARFLRGEDRGIVIIIDVTAERMATREPQVTLLMSSLFAPGHVPGTLTGQSVKPLDADRIAALLRFLDDARMRLAIPGVGIGMVQDGKVVHAGGLGVRRLGSQDAVDASTRFLSASITKPLTSLMLARLVDAGDFSWDTRVVDVWPDFRVGDPDLTRRLQLRHLLCACTGIPAQDMEWTFSGESLSGEQMMEVLAGIQPNAGIGELYQYSNLMAAASGFLGAQHLHPDLPLTDAYDRAMQAQVFDPLGMAATTFDIDHALAGNHASPHGSTLAGDTVIVPMDYNRMSLPMRPDGGAWSNVDDLNRYLMMELSGGLLPDGYRYIRREALQARQVGQVARGGIRQWYGMGLKIDHRRGLSEVRHGGSMAGYQGEIYWLPEHGTGFVLLINADAGTHLRGLFVDRFLEVLFDQDLGSAAQLERVVTQSRMSRIETLDGLQLPVPEVVRAGLATVYRHPVLGRVRVQRKSDALWFDFDGWASEMGMSRNAGDSVVLESVSPSVGGYRFRVGLHEDARALVLEDGSRSYRFLADEGKTGDAVSADE